MSEILVNMVYYQDYDAQHSKEKFLPDGTTNLIIDLEGTPKYIYDNDTLQEQQRCQYAWFSGMHTRYLTISSGVNSQMMVITFRAGGAFEILNQSLAPFTNAVVDATEVFGEQIVTLRQALQQEQDNQARFGLVEAFLQTNLNPPKPSYHTIQQAQKQIVESSGTVNLAELAKTTGYSQKQFIQLFKTYVGLTPKQFHRIVRFNDILASMHKQQQVDWTLQAQVCGYFDQAHFIKDFQAFSGLNPESYLVEQGEWQHYVPVK